MAQEAAQNRTIKYRSLEASEHAVKARHTGEPGQMRVCVGCGATFQQSTIFGFAKYCTKTFRSHYYSELNKLTSKKVWSRKPDGTFQWSEQKSEA